VNKCAALLDSALVYTALMFLAKVCTAALIQVGGTRPGSAVAHAHGSQIVNASPQENCVLEHCATMLSECAALQSTAVDGVGDVATSIDDGPKRLLAPIEPRCLKQHQPLALELSFNINC
jgi:hypothetical protein